jgi:hypothetical protein
MIHSSGGGSPTLVCSIVPHGGSLPTTADLVYDELLVVALTRSNDKVAMPEC